MITKYSVRKAPKERHLDQKIASQSNVVSLNRNIEPTILANIEQSMETAKQIRENLVEDTKEIMMEQFVGSLAIFGVFIEKVNYKDLIMIENAFASMLSRYYGIDHPLHEVTDEVFQFDNEDQEDQVDEEQPLTEK